MSSSIDVDEGGDASSSSLEVGNVEEGEEEEEKEESFDRKSSTNPVHASHVTSFEINPLWIAISRSLG